MWVRELLLANVMRACVRACLLEQNVLELPDIASLRKKIGSRAPPPVTPPGTRVAYVRVFWPVFCERTAELLLDDLVSCVAH
jgi:hypothetical protein